jgi:hypothetical protein
MLDHISCRAPNQHDSEQHTLWLAARGTRGKGGMAGTLEVDTRRRGRPSWDAGHSREGLYSR